jgi:hypothetical protein
MWVWIALGVLGWLLLLAIIWALCVVAAWADRKAGRKP